MLLAVWRGTEYCEYSAWRCVLCLHEAAGLVPDTHCHDPALHCAACALTLYSATLYTVHCTGDNDTPLHLHPPFLCADSNLCCDVYISTILHMDSFGLLDSLMTTFDGIFRIF